MARNTETTDIRQQDKQTTEHGNDAPRARNADTETRSDRERGLQTSRESGAQTGIARSQGAGWGNLTGSLPRSPFAVMRRMMEDMDRMFEDFGLSRSLGGDLGSARGFSPLLSSELWGSGGDSTTALWSPAVEVLEKGDKLVVRAELPGVAKDDVTVDVTDEALTIEGERRQESEDRGEGYYRSERSYGRFLRTIPLPEGVDAERAEARFRDGVLEVTLPAPKREQKRGRKLSIR